MEHVATWSETGLLLFTISLLYKLKLKKQWILQQYLDAAEQDKERYNREISDYKQTEAYRLFTEKQTEKQNENKKERNGTAVNPEQNVQSHCCHIWNWLLQYNVVNGNSFF